MADPIIVLDPLVDASADSAVTALGVPLRVGSDFQTGDLRIVRVYIDHAHASSWGMGTTPSGWTKSNETVVAGGGGARVVVYSRTLTAGDSDAFVTFNGSTNKFYYATSLSVRNQIQGQSLVVSSAAGAQSTSNVAPSVATGLGVLVTYHLAGYAGAISNFTFTDPAGMTRFHVQEETIASNKWSILVALEARTSGSSGSRTATTSASAQQYPTSLFVAQAPDVVATLAKITGTAATAKAVTANPVNLTTWPLPKLVLPSAVVKPMWTPLGGYRVSDPIVVDSGRVAGSRIAWTATAAPGAQVLVDTSVDGGASWQTAANGGQIPRLAIGATTIRSVLTRVTLTRESVAIPKPRVHDLVVELSVDVGADELVPLGVFTINDTEVADSVDGGLTVRVSGVDLSRKVARNRWHDVYVVPILTNYGTAIRDIIADRFPEAKFNFASTTRVTPRLIFGEQGGTDPWADAQGLATAIGMELYTDSRGVFTLREEPDPDVGTAVWELTDQSRPTITALSRRISDQDVYNRVVVIAEGSQVASPIRAVAQDDDPTSPTYVLGPYGTVTTELRSSMITSQEQADEAAQAYLRRVKGLTEAVDLSFIPMPALEPGHIVIVTRGRSKVAGQFLIDTLSIPLGATQLARAVCRRQRLG